MKINIDDKIEIIDEDENIYQKLARAIARATDINLGKTTLADLLDGYTKNKILQQKIDKANEILNKSCFEYDNCPDSVINEIIELKEILGDKE